MAFSAICTGFFIPLFGIDFGSDLSAQHLELVDGRRTIDVARHEQHLASLLALEHRRQLAREGSLTGALQTGDQDDRRRALQLDVGRRAAHELCQLVADDLGNHLSRLDGLEHVLSQGLLLHLVGEGFGYLVIASASISARRISLRVSATVDFGDAAFALDQLEGPFEFYRFKFSNIVSVRYRMPGNGAARRWSIFSFCGAVVAVGFFSPDKAKAVSGKSFSLFGRCRSAPDFSLANI